MAKFTASVGPIVGSGANKTDAKGDAIARASGVLWGLHTVRPELVVWKGEACLVYPTFHADGQLAWMYTNPRPIDVLASDAGRERMGTGGYWDRPHFARSAALCHLIQNDPNGIPDELPAELEPKDRENLCTLRAYHKRAADVVSV